MIKSIKANKCFDINSGRLNYLGGITRDTNIQHLNSLFEKGIEFSPGNNIIIGANGAGKTTLLNLIRYVTFCKESFIPELDITDLSTKFEPEYNKYIYENINVKADYDMPIYNLFQMSAESNVDENMAFKDTNAAMQFMDLKSKSRGQNIMGDISQLLHMMFDTCDYQLVSDLVSKYVTDAKKYGIFSDIVDNFDNYYKKNNESDSNVTILMDEPDQGLDIDNLEQVMGLLSYNKPDTQLITVVHNPILIYKLSKLSYVNIIEMTDGYLDKIKKFVEN